MESDEELVGRFRKGEQGAFAELYDRYERRLFSYLLVRTRDEHSAEDLLHDVFAGFLQYVRGTEIYDSVRAFLFTSARNHAINWGRKSRPVLGTMPEIFDRTGAGADRAVEWLALLPPDQQEVVHLHLWGNLTFAEIARVQGGSINTVMSRYRYAMETLRRHERE